MVTKLYIDLQKENIVNCVQAFVFVFFIIWSFVETVLLYMDHKLLIDIKPGVLSHLRL